MFKKILLAIALLLPVMASAQTLKIGLVDTNTVIAALPATAQAQKTLQDRQTQYKADYEKLMTELQTKYEELQNMPEDEVKAVKERKTREFQDLSQKVQLFEQQIQTELQQLQDKLMQPILNNVRAAIESVARENGFSMVQDNAQQITLYYAAPVEDITPLVKTKLGVK